MYDLLITQKEKTTQKLMYRTFEALHVGVECSHELAVIKESAWVSLESVYLAPVLVVERLLGDDAEEIPLTIGKSRIRTALDVKLECSM